MQLLLSIIQRCVVILIQNKIWCSLFECFCSTALFSWLFYKLWADSWKTPNHGYFYNQHSHRLVHTCRKSPILHWSYNNTNEMKSKQSCAGYSKLVYVSSFDIFQSFNLNWQGDHIEVVSPELVFTSYLYICVNECFLVKHWMDLVS